MGTRHLSGGTLQVLPPDAVYFQRPQMGAPGILGRSYSCIVWGKQGEGCLFHLLQNQNLITHFICFIVGKST